MIHSYLVCAMPMRSVEAFSLHLTFDKTSSSLDTVPEVL